MARRKKIAEFTGSKCTAKVYRDAEWNEYVVRAPNAEYFTADKDDAIATAKHMAGPDLMVDDPLACEHGIKRVESCAACRRCVAEDVRVGDAIGGRVVKQAGRADHAPFFYRFYLENGEVVEFLRGDTVSNHATQLALKMAAADNVIRVAEWLRRCECESLECHPHGCTNSFNPKLVTTYGTRLCERCAAKMPARFMKSNS